MFATPSAEKSVHDTRWLLGFLIFYTLLLLILTPLSLLSAVALVGLVITGTYLPVFALLHPKTLQVSFSDAVIYILLGTATTALIILLSLMAQWNPLYTTALLPIVGMATLWRYRKAVVPRFQGCTGITDKPFFWLLAFLFLLPGITMLLISGYGDYPHYIYDFENAWHQTLAHSFLRQDEPSYPPQILVYVNAYFSYQYGPSSLAAHFARILGSPIHTIFYLYLSFLFLVSLPVLAYRIVRHEQRRLGRMTIPLFGYVLVGSSIIDYHVFNRILYYILKGAQGILPEAGETWVSTILLERKLLPLAGNYIAELAGISLCLLLLHTLQRCRFHWRDMVLVSALCVFIQLFKAALLVFMALGLTIWCLTVAWQRRIGSPLVLLASAGVAALFIKWLFGDYSDFKLIPYLGYAFQYFMVGFLHHTHIDLGSFGPGMPIEWDWDTVFGSYLMSAGFFGRLASLILSTLDDLFPPLLLLFFLRKQRPAFPWQKALPWMGFIILPYLFPNLFVLLQTSVWKDGMTFYHVDILQAYRLQHHFMSFFNVMVVGFILSQTTLSLSEQIKRRMHFAMKLFIAPFFVGYLFSTGLTLYYLTPGNPLAQIYFPRIMDYFRFRNVELGEALKHIPVKGSLIVTNHPLSDYVPPLFGHAMYATFRGSGIIIDQHQVDMVKLQMTLQKGSISSEFMQAAKRYGWTHLLIFKTHSYPESIPLTRLYENSEYIVYRF
ncbi:hypothetical protein ACQZV8_11870 [Magnetococcales bacterium HHB-1]